MQIICRGSKLWQLLACSAMAFWNTFKFLLQAENSMTGRAYMGEVLTQVWLKSVKKWVSYSTYKWMHKKRIWKILPRFMGAPASPQKSVRWKWKKQTNKQRRKKNDGRLKYFCGQEGVYKTRAESLCNEYQTISAQRFLIHWRYHLFSKRVNVCQGDGFSSVGTRMGAIKLAMAGTQDWWRRFPPLLGC